MTNSHDDGGIDALHYHAASNTIFVVQSKWNESGSRSINGGETAKFVNGIRDLLQPNFDNFNDKIRKKEAEIRAALYSEMGVNFAFVTAGTSIQPISEHAKRSMKSFIFRVKHTRARGAHRIPWASLGL